jgi:glutathione S-transferase
MPELTLYDYAASANCYKVRLLLAQLERPYRRVSVDIFAGETLTDRFAEMNPMRTTPVLGIPPDRFLPESNAILLYLAEGTPFLPDDAEARAHVYRWLIFEQTDVMPTMGGLRFRLLTRRLEPDSPDALRRLHGAQATLALLDRHLDHREFFVGDRYTIADIGLFAYTHVAGDAGLDLGRYPGVQAWLARVREQPRFSNDLEPYPENAFPGKGKSTYDG